MARATWWLTKGNDASFRKMKMGVRGKTCHTN